MATLRLLVPVPVEKYIFHLGGRSRQISEFEASLVYKVISMTARAIQRNPVSKKQNKQQQKKSTFFFFFFRRVGGLQMNSSVSYTSLEWETSSRSRLDPSSSFAGHYPLINVTRTLLNPIVDVKGGSTL